MTEPRDNWRRRASGYGIGLVVLVSAAVGVMILTIHKGNEEAATLGGGPAREQEERAAKPSTSQGRVRPAKDDACRSALVLVNAFCRKIADDVPPRYTVHLRSTGPEPTHVTGVSVNGRPLSISELYADGSSSEPTVPIAKVPKDGVADKQVLWYDVRPGIDVLGPGGHIEFVMQMATNTRLPVELSFSGSSGHSVSCHLAVEPPALRITGTGWSEARESLYVYVENRDEAPIELSKCVVNEAEVGEKRLTLVGFPVPPGTKACVIVRHVGEGIIKKPCWLDIGGKEKHQRASALMRIVPGFAAAYEFGEMPKLGEHARSSGVYRKRNLEALLEAGQQGDIDTSLCIARCPAHAWGDIRPGVLRLIRSCQSLRRRGCTAPLYTHVCRRHIAEYLPLLAGATEITRTNPMSPILTSWTPSRGARTGPQKILSLARAASEPGIAHPLLSVTNEPPYLKGRAANAAEIDLLLSYTIASGARGALIRVKGPKPEGDVLGSGYVAPVTALKEFLDIAEPLGIRKTSNPSVGCSVLLLGDLGLLAVLVNDDTSWLTRKPTELNTIPEYPQPAVISPSSNVAARIRLPAGLAFAEAWEVKKGNDDGPGKYYGADAERELVIHFDSVRTARYVLLLTSRGEEVLGGRQGMRRLAKAAGALPNWLVQLEPQVSGANAEVAFEEPAGMELPQLQWVAPFEILQRPNVVDLVRELNSLETVQEASTRLEKATTVARKARQLIENAKGGQEVIGPYEVFLRAQELRGHVTRRRKDFADYLGVIADSFGEVAAVGRAWVEATRFIEAREYPEAVEYLKLAMERPLDDREARAFLLLQLGHAHRKAREFKSAIRCFRKILDDRQDTECGTEAMFETAHCYYEAGVDKKGDALMDKLREAKPDAGARALTMKAWYARSHNRRAEAIAHITRLKLEYPNSPEARQMAETAKDLMQEELKEMDVDF